MSDFSVTMIGVGALGLAFGRGGQEKAREILRRISKVEKVEEGDPPAIAEKNRGACDAEKGEPYEDRDRPLESQVTSWHTRFFPSLFARYIRASALRNA